MAQHQLLVSNKVIDVCRDFVLTRDDLELVTKKLTLELNQGLGKATNADATVKCFPTYVRNLPTGTERGRFLALDLGGTNFRVLLIELGGECDLPPKYSCTSEIPKDIMHGTGRQLFDHIAECLSNFMKEHDLEAQKLPLGFTFSFPLRQEGLKKARLVAWTKGFNCAGVEGEDVVFLLQEAIKRRGDVEIEVVAVLNDTTGILMACAYNNPNCRVGLSLGTGLNACYVERLESVELWEGDNNDPAQMIINTECGAFGDNGCLEFIMTEYDHEIDQRSLKPKTHLFEKMVSGMYMGELVRLVLIKLTNDGQLFIGQDTDNLFKQGNFFTKYISEIESDKGGEFVKCRQVLEKLCLVDITDQDCHHVRYVCEVISTRAAQLTAAAVACLLNKMNKKKVVVAVDGSVYRFHPHFHTRMVDTIKKLVSQDIEFKLMLSADGSGRGAAVVAAVTLTSK